MKPNKKQRYKTTNWRSYNKALKQRGSLTVWLDPNLKWMSEPTGRRGRQKIYSEAAIQSCLTLKVLFKMPLCQTIGFVESILKLMGLDWTVPDFSTLCRRQEELRVDISYQGSQGPLHLLIDSTGIKVKGEGEWLRCKQGGSKRRVLRKVHLGIDEKTLEIRAVEVTTSSIGDAPMLPELLKQISPEQAIASVTADGAYDSRKCHVAITDRGADAVIPPRKNARLQRSLLKGDSVRNEAVKACQYLGKAIWRQWSNYHRRSLAETKMHCLKLLGNGFMVREFKRQVSELHVRITILNRYTALGLPHTVPARSLYLRYKDFCVLLSFCATKPWR